MRRRRCEGTRDPLPITDGPSVNLAEIPPTTEWETEAAGLLYRWQLERDRRRGRTNQSLPSAMNGPETPFIVSFLPSRTGSRRHAHRNYYNYGHLRFIVVITLIAPLLTLVRIGIILRLITWAITTGITYFLLNKLWVTVYELRKILTRLKETTNNTDPRPWCDVTYYQ